MKLKTAISKHKLWQDSRGEEGKQLVYDGDDHYIYDVRPKDIITATTRDMGDLEDATFCNIEFNDFDFEDETWENIAFKDCSFRHCNFSETVLRRANLHRSRFYDCITGGRETDIISVQVNSNQIYCYLDVNGVRFAGGCQGGFNVKAVKDYLSRIDGYHSDSYVATQKESINFLLKQAKRRGWTNGESLTI